MEENAAVTADEGIALHRYALAAQDLLIRRASREVEPEDEPRDRPSVVASPLSPWKNPEVTGRLARAQQELAVLVDVIRKTGMCRDGAGPFGPALGVAHAPKDASLGIRALQSDDGSTVVEVNELQVSACRKRRVLLKGAERLREAAREVQEQSARSTEALASLGRLLQGWPYGCVTPLTAQRLLKAWVERMRLALVESNPEAGLSARPWFDHLPRLEGTPLIYRVAAVLCAPREEWEAVALAMCDRARSEPRVGLPLELTDAQRAAQASAWILPLAAQWTDVPRQSRRGAPPPAPVSPLVCCAPTSNQCCPTVSLVPTRQDATTHRVTLDLDADSPLSRVHRVLSRTWCLRVDVIDGSPAGSVIARTQATVASKHTHDGALETISVSLSLLDAYVRWCAELEACRVVQARAGLHAARQCGPLGGWALVSWAQGGSPLAQLDALVASVVDSLAESAFGLASLGALGDMAPPLNEERGVGQVMHILLDEGGTLSLRLALHPREETYETEHASKSSWDLADSTVTVSSECVEGAEWASLTAEEVLRGLLAPTASMKQLWTPRAQVVGQAAPSLPRAMNLAHMAAIRGISDSLSSASSSSAAATKVALEEVVVGSGDVIPSLGVRVTVGERHSWVECLRFWKHDLTCTSSESATAVRGPTIAARVHMALHE
jgi:hypothetical protein